MALYFVGDIQGCDAAFKRLMDKVNFSPSQDQLYVLGDMVNRGPGSLAVLRQLHAWQGAAFCLLGNHDIHLLSVLTGQQPSRSEDTFQDVLQASDKESLFDWLRHCPLAYSLTYNHHHYLLVHAGVLPAWDLHQALSLAREVEMQLQGSRPQVGVFLKEIYGNKPDTWHENLRGIDRFRVIINAFTRLRFCTAQGRMDFEHKTDIAPSPDYQPWFEFADRRTAQENLTVVFGHWSSLSLVEHSGLLGLDTGCVWGRTLTAARLTHQSGEYELITSG
jgi:bis(5'-nucleosyl)-tetraphosphatase (symmetrical)